MITINVMIKDGGYQNVHIEPEMIGQLAESIKRQGSEWITLLSGPIQVVGFIVAGEQTGARLIVLGKSGD